MNLIQSICCFVSSRCASGEAESKKDRYARDASTSPSPHLVPQRLKPKSRPPGGHEGVFSESQVACMAMRHALSQGRVSRDVNMSATLAFSVSIT
jgi:hypothetical protein